MELAFCILGYLAWLGATTLPLTLAIWFWGVAERSRVRWLIHLLYAPSAAATELTMGWLLFYAAHDDGSGPPGLGIALLPAMLLFALAVPGYYICVAHTAMRTLLLRRGDKKPRSRA